jgi:hypothetical protein
MNRMKSEPYEQWPYKKRSYKKWSYKKWPYKKWPYKNRPYKKNYWSTHCREVINFFLNTNRPKTQRWPTAKKKKTFYMWSLFVIYCYLFKFTVLQFIQCYRWLYKDQSWNSLLGVEFSVAEPELVGRQHFAGAVGEVFWPGSDSGYVNS